MRKCNCDTPYVEELVFDESGMRGEKGERGDAPALSVAKVAPYLYTITYHDWDYDKAIIYTMKHGEGGACAAVRKGDMLGHNYDAAYDETAEFFLRTQASMGRHASVGMASIPGVLTAEMADGNPEDDSVKEYYDMLPFMTADGVNDAGVAVAMNSVPGDYGTTTGTNDGGRRMPVFMLVRYLLDYAGTVAEAINLLAELDIYTPIVDGNQQEYHLMIADKYATAVIEFVDNEMIVIAPEDPESLPLMTNFHLYGYDGTDESLESHARGVERYGILASGYEDIETADDMNMLIKSVFYTGVYDEQKDPFWYSDYRGDWTEQGYGDLTKDSAPEDYAAIVADSVAKYQERTRDGQTMHTVHTVVYDVNLLTALVTVQEGNQAHHFCMDSMMLIYAESERAQAAEAELDERFDDYYTQDEIDESLTNLHDTIDQRITDGLAGKVDEPVSAGVSGQVLAKGNAGNIWRTLPQYLPDVTSEDNDKVMVVEDGEWVLSDKFADYIRYQNITVNITSDNGGVCTGGLMITVKNGDTGEVINQSEFVGQPVTFHVPRGMHYLIEQSGTWEGYHNPRPAYFDGAATSDTTLVFTYEAIRVPTTLRELQLIVDSGNAGTLADHIGLQFEDTYTENGTTYPVIWDLKDVQTVYDENNEAHTGVALEWHYATPTAMPFDAPEREEVDLTREPTAQSGLYYYGGTGSSSFRLLTVNEGDPLPTTYDAVYKNTIRNPDGNVIRRGSSLYAESVPRKWLNSDGDAGEWFVSSHVGDVAPEEASTMPGFMRGCSAQILDMVKPVRIACAISNNTVSYVYDKFFIPSVDEVFGLYSGAVEGTPWADWVDATGWSEPSNSANTGRRVYADDTAIAQNVGLRSMNVSYQYINWMLQTNGSIDGYANANTLRKYTPCCVIYA